MSTWRKASRSNSEGGACVEARTQAGRFEVRDSKLGEESAIFDMTKGEWKSFLNLARK